MKKIFISVFLLIFSAFIFAKTFDNNGLLIDKFMQSGTYIKYIQDENTILYINKSSILSIESQEDSIYVRSNGGVFDILEMELPIICFYTSNNTIKLDTNNNLIITKN